MKNDNQLSYVEMRLGFIRPTQFYCNTSPDTPELHTSDKSWYTYIHKWSVQPFCQDYDLASHSIYMLCMLNVSMSGSLKTSKDRFKKEN